jgi:hypothetical protein
MFDTVFDGLRKATESSWQLQQDFVKLNWAKSMQKHYETQTLDLIQKSREMADAAYRCSIEIVQQMFRLSDVRSPDEGRRAAEELWRRIYEFSKDQYTRQFSQAQKWAESSLALTHTHNGSP